MTETSPKQSHEAKAPPGMKVIVRTAAAGQVEIGAQGAARKPSGSGFLGLPAWASVV